MIKIAIFVTLVAVALASDAYPEDPAANEAEVRNILGHKQHEVNRKAAYHGAGVGTAPYAGVPGTDVRGHGYGYGYPGYGYAGYPYGHHGYGYGAYGAYGYPYAYHH